MKAELTITSVTKDGLIVKLTQGPSIMIAILTPRDAMDVIRHLKNGLFEWSKLTGKSIDGGNPA